MCSHACASASFFLYHLPTPHAAECTPPWPGGGGDRVLMHPPCIIVSAHSPDNTGRELRPKPLLLLPPLTLLFLCSSAVNIRFWNSLSSAMRTRTSRDQRGATSGVTSSSSLGTEEEEASV